MQATVIPAGEPAVLPAGTKVTITHRLGGNFTVVCDAGMFRIKGADADALGEQPPSDATENEGKTDAYGSVGTAEHPGHTGKPSDEAVWESLKKVFDPEIPVNIVDLGLVYFVKNFVGLQLLGIAAAVKSLMVLPDDVGQRPRKRNIFQNLITGLYMTLH